MDIETLPTTDSPPISDVKHYIVNEDGTQTEVSEEEVRAAFTNDGEVATEYVDQ